MNDRYSSFQVIQLLSLEKTLLSKTASLSEEKLLQLVAMSALEF
jgi:hypothetical protein